MPIDTLTALGADPVVRPLSWTADDVLLYHLSLGAGARGKREELRRVYEKDLDVLPTFAVVAGRRTVGDPVEGGRSMMQMPGIDIDLRKVLHLGQQLRLHAPLPVAGTAVGTSRIADIWDKGRAAVIVTEETVCADDGTPLWTARSQIWARGEGGFGGPEGERVDARPPNREPDVTIDAPTSAQAAALYRLNGDRNPLHIDPAFAAAAGLDRPILHGLATYGITAMTLVDVVLGAAQGRVRAFGARFAGVLAPGETLRVLAWRDGPTVDFTVQCAERGNAPVLTHGRMELAEDEAAGQRVPAPWAPER